MSLLILIGIFVFVQIVGYQVQSDLSFERKGI